MTTVDKIELIIPSAYAQHRLIAKLDEWGINGYSIIKEAIGKGRSGIQQGDLPADVGRSWYIIIASETSRTKLIVEEFRPIISRYGGICLVTSVNMLKKDANSEDSY